MNSNHDIVEEPEQFNQQEHRTSRLFVVVGVLLALGSIALSVYILIQ